MKERWRICPTGGEWGEWVEIDCDFAILGSEHVTFCDSHGDVIAIVTLANTFLVCLESDDFGMRPA